MIVITPSSKQCSSKEDYIHPEKVGDGWLPESSIYFGKHKGGKNGFNPKCKECHCKRTTKWAKDNPEKRMIITKTYVENNPETRKETSRNYTKNNSVKLNEYGQKYREENPGKRQETVNKSHAKRKKRNQKFFGITTTSGAPLYTEPKDRIRAQIFCVN